MRFPLLAALLLAGSTAMAEPSAVPPSGPPPGQAAPPSIRPQVEATAQDSGDAALAAAEEKASSGKASDQMAVAKLLLRPSGSAKPGYADAASWLGRAAGQGDAEAQFLLSNLLYAGSGVPQDSKEALRQLALSADAGYVPAETALGGLYAQGILVQEDDARAAALFAKAADHDDPMAQASLGAAYLQGKGVAADKEQAVFWFAVAASGHGPNSDQLKVAAGALGGRLPPDAVQRLAARLAEWRRTHTAPPGDF